MNIYIRTMLTLMSVYVLSGYFLISCISVTEENTTFEEDTFIKVQMLRNYIGQNSNIDRSSSYFAYGITRGEIVLRVNTNLPVNLYLIEDREPLSKEKTQHKNIVEVNMDNTQYSFNDDENTIWLSALMSVLSYAQSDYFVKDDSVEVLSESDDSPLSLGYTTGIDSVKAGEIFINVLRPYINYEKKRVSHIMTHPIIHDLNIVLDTHEEARINHFYDSLFEVTSHSLKLVYDTAMLEEILKEDLYIESDFLIDDPLLLPNVILNEQVDEDTEEDEIEE